ncbi:unnamed protein product, partial [Symbiodinium sp. CCMP2592]
MTVARQPGHSAAIKQTHGLTAATKLISWLECQDARAFHFAGTVPAFQRPSLRQRRPHHRRGRLWRRVFRASVRLCERSAGADGRPGPTAEGLQGARLHARDSPRGDAGEAWNQREASSRQTVETARVATPAQRLRRRARYMSGLTRLSETVLVDE